MNTYDSIRQGLTEALALAEGKDVGAQVHEIEVPAAVQPARRKCFWR